ncbi:MAG: hypothetical protein KC877_00820 [Candidatus Kaiserbacteria bacterium]|nr:hypothetical protein [Candidatus Kaiserbacteria bacterium]MCB9816835.1 hypothetical protein [Candidatus Nomurabacteria bacterium]
MADLSNNSFIPKRGPAKRRREVMSRQVYVFTLISYVLLFATLLATGGVFFYGQYIDKEWQSQVEQLNTRISSFSEADLQRVLEFDRRLQQATDRVESSVSIVSVLKALEAATAGTVQLEDLSLTREMDSEYMLAAAVNTDTFDSTIFQRDLFTDSEIIADVSVMDVKALSEADAAQERLQEDKNAILNQRSAVDFKVELTVPIEAIPYVPPDAPITVSAPVVTSPVSPIATTTAVDVNDNDL